MKTNEVYAEWKCPDCGWSTLFSYQEMVEAGNPICMECDTEMDLESDRIILDRVYDNLIKVKE